MGVFQEAPPLIRDMETKNRRVLRSVMGEHKEPDGKVISTVGFILHLLLVAIPKDIYLWLSRRRKDVTGQTVVITGGASGIGQRMAEIFAIDLGANVAIVDVDLSKAESVAQSIRERQGSAAAFQSDVTCPKAIEACADSIKNTFGRVDIIICNAAILYFKHTLELTSDQLQRAYNVNVMGVLNTIRAFLPEFENENRGQIVAMSSIAGFYGETYGIAPTKIRCSWNYGMLTNGVSRQRIGWNKMYNFVPIFCENTYDFKPRHETDFKV
ncbi:hypothetical protein M3Y97_00317000 [Aphelenchoides bicaudatus]|nr:hypothetical protein M3Y97_00317000 [Aphelenchoides bicaudatus]